MSLIISVAQSDPCFDPLLHFQAQDDKKILRLFKAGGVLHVRKGSAPSDTWLEHSGSAYPLIPNLALGRALQALGKLANPALTSEAPAPSQVDCWVFAPEKLKYFSSRWRRAKKCALDWQNRRGPLPTDTSGLSEKALATLRHMKRQSAMCMHRELFDVWRELNARGFVAVNANGGVSLHPTAKAVPVPWGPMLKIVPVSQEVLPLGLTPPSGPVLPEPLSVANPISCSDPLAKLAHGSGPGILALFKSGATLHVYRGMTPNKWRLEHRDGREHHFEQDISTARALTNFGKLKNSRGVVPNSLTGVHNDGGKPMGETWAYNKGLLLGQSRAWSHAQDCANDWNQSAGAFDKDTSDLSPRAQATLRTLLQKYTLPMYPELFSVWLELNAKGYLEVFPEGYAQLTSAARDVVVERGARLELQNSGAKLPTGALQ